MGSSDRFNRGIVGRRARLLGLTLAAGLAIGAGSAAPSLASTVSTGSGTLTYSAASGEANQTVVSLAGGTYTVQDSGATITAGAGCSSVNANKATCPGAGITTLSVNAGNMTNTVWNTTSTNSTIIAGDGNDTLIGGSGNDAMIGCGGDDTYNGGPGADTLVDAFGCAGGGNDTFDGGPGPDAIFGGSGSDAVTYAGRTASVFVSLDNVANDGEAGEGDNIHDDVENVTGGSGDDNITGSSAANLLSGGAAGDDVLVGEPNDNSGTGSSGNDVIIGGDGNDALEGGNGSNLMIGGNGNDALYGGPGADTIDGGAGNDGVHALDGVVDSINCGPDSDSGEADDIDVLNPNCEAVSFTSADGISGIDGSDSGSDFTDCGSDFRASSSASSNPSDPLGGILGGLDPCLAAQSAVCAAVGVSHRTTLHGGAVVVRVHLPKALADSGLVCKGRLRLDIAAGKPHKPQSRRLIKVASKSFSLEGGKSKRVDLRISRAGLRLLQDAQHTPAKLSILANGSAAMAAPIVIASPGH